MRVLVALEHHFERTPDGAVWTQIAYTSRFWERFLAVFEQVLVVARVHETAAGLPDRVRADGKNISFAGLPDYTGPLQYLTRVREISGKTRGAFRMGDAVILRVPSTVATTLLPTLNGRRYPYAVQVVGDPYDVFAPGVVEHPLRRFWRFWMTRQLKQQCVKAIAAAYVTDKYLQRRYPCPASMTSFTDVELPEEAFVKAPHLPRDGVGPLRLVTVASLAQMYKAPDILIQAVGLCSGRGIDVELVIIGDGKYRSVLEAKTQALGLQEHVHFLGQLRAGADVRAQLDAADMFVLPSRVEGLPRAMLEAMARGLACIGSTAGGIPELLAEEDLVPPGDPNALADKIREIVPDQGRMTRMAERNLVVANEYRSERLALKQNAFYRHVRERTQEWLGQPR